jgi:hypothetical protein
VISITDQGGDDYGDIDTHESSANFEHIRGVIEKFQDCSYFSFPVLDVATLYSIDFPLKFNESKLSLNHVFINRNVLLTMILKSNLF